LFGFEQLPIDNVKICFYNHNQSKKSIYAHYGWRNFMLTEERKKKICEYIEQQKAVTVLELMELFSASEATIRRDLTDLSARGLLVKVHGGAVSIQNQIVSDYRVEERKDVNSEEKIVVAKYAASLIQSNDMVYLDAGTTTYHLIDYVNSSNNTFVTNAVMHARKLSAKGYSVYLTGGKLKSTTEALVGAGCYESLQSYQFSIGFFGANAISHEDGFTTPDPEEAKIKECALKHTLSPYILCDHGKFDLTAPVRFANYTDACIITTGNIPNEYRKDPTIVLV
jgi:DeoR family fructose operon transcriptional repressor